MREGKKLLYYHSPRSGQVLYLCMAHDFELPIFNQASLGRPTNIHLQTKLKWDGKSHAVVSKIWDVPYKKIYSEEKPQNGPSDATPANTIWEPTAEVEGAAA